MPTHCTGDLPYQLRVQKPGFYQGLENQTDAHRQTIEVMLAHEQVVRQEVNVVSSTPGIDTEQTSDKSTFNTPEIVNMPYPTSRDIRNLLPFTPGVVQDGTGQIHVAGSETYATLDLLDGFDIRSPGQRRARDARQRGCSSFHRYGNNPLPGRIRQSHGRRRGLLHRDGR